MMLTKLIGRVPALSTLMFLALVCAWQSMASQESDRNRASKELSSSLGMQKGNPPAQNSLEQDIDTFFAKIKIDFDEIATSPDLKYPSSKKVNSLFWRSLKAKTHQPWHSLIRTDKKGNVINEVIRIEGVSKEKRSIAGQAWFTRTSKTLKEHTDIIKTETTGRYYLLWAAPIVSTVKGKETFQGAVMAHIDLWDCFDQFSNISPVPFKIRILGRKVLYDHRWTDTIKYVEKPLIVPGIDKITVRYPDMTATVVAAAIEQAKLDSIKMDSIQTKAAADLAAQKVAIQKAAIQKAKSRNTIIGTILIATALLILIIGLVFLAKNRRRKYEFNSGEEKDRFDNLI